MNRISFFYGSGSGFSGQRFALELLIKGLRQRGWHVQIVNTPLLNRVAEHSGAGIYASRLGLALHLLIAWMKGLRLAFGPGIMIVGLGQTKFALIRDGFPLLFKRIFVRSGRAIIALNGNLLMHWDYHSLEAKFLRSLAQAAGYITVVGPNQKTQLIALGIPAEKVAVIDNTCLLSSITTQECKDKQTLTDQQPLNILYLSSLIESKGYPEFVETIGKLATRASFPVEATLCGKITLAEADSQFITFKVARDWIEERIAQINKSSFVRLHWINGATGAAKEKLFREAHIFILPSQYKIEAQPIAILEALSSGCAVITTKVGEIPTTVSDQTALLLDIVTPETIAEAILNLQHNPDKRQQLALDGLKLYEKRFAYSNHIDRWEKLLCEMDKV